MFGSKLPPAFFIVPLAVLSFGLPEIRAQANSSVVGLIRDPAGAVVPGVEVSIEHVGTGLVRTTLSTDRGGYRVTELAPGLYVVAASHPGFKTSIAKFEVTTGEAVHLDLKLELGAIAERVEVTDAATAVNVEQGRVSGLVDAHEISDLPLNGRNVYELMRLTAGTVDSRATIAEPGQGTNVNGGRKNMNGFWVDGVTNKGLSGGAGAEDYFGVAGSNPPPHPILDAIREFRIETLNFSAEYGNSIGSVVNLVTKSGGNSFHGSFLEFHRNRALDARQFFDEEKPQFTQNQFGFSLGGPLVRDNTFFFAAYEGTRIRRSRTQISVFESPQWAAYAAENGGPVARFLYSNYPGPTLDTTGSTVGEYLFENGYVCWDEEGLIAGCSPMQANVDALLGRLFGSSPGAIDADAPMVGESAFLLSRPLNADGISLRVDHNLGTADQIYGRYFLTDWRTLQPQPRPGLDSPTSSSSQQLALNWIHIFSPALVNEGRAGYTRNGGGSRVSAHGLPYVADISEILTFNPGIRFDGRENVFTWADTVSLVRGDHSLKLGFEARRNQENSEFDIGIASYLFFDLVLMALDAPDLQVAGVEPRLDQGPEAAQLASNFRGWRSSEVGVFVNDDWKIRPNLTLNIGLRWDWYGRLTEAQGRATAFQMSSGGDLPERVAMGEFVGPVPKLSPEDWNNFAPRLGLAWDPFSDGKMSVRAGFGVAYQSEIFNPLSNSRWNKPFYSFNYAFPLVGIGRSIIYGPQDGSAVRVQGPNPNPGASLREGNIMAWDPANPNLAILTGIPNPGMRDPYVMSFFAGIQRELARDTTLEVNYVGTLGRKLLRAEDFNRFSGDLLGWPDPVNGAGLGDEDFNGLNPNEGVLRFWENSANSNYHSLQVSLDRRYARGLAFHASYTLAKSLDVRSTWHDGATTHNGWHEGFSVEAANSRLDYGRSIFDARHRLTFHWLWQPSLFEKAGGWFLRHVAGGWQINGILALQSGQPFTPWTGLPFAAGGDFNADGNANDRPNAPAIGNSISGSRNDFLNPNSGIFNISGNSYEHRLAYFGRPEPGSVGTLGRNTYEGPGYANLDVSLFKEIDLPRMGEEGQLQFRVEFFNILNRVNLLQPKTNLADLRFGRSTKTFDAREIQFGIKLVF